MAPHGSSSGVSFSNVSERVVEVLMWREAPAASNAAAAERCPEHVAICSAVKPYTPPRPVACVSDLQLALKHTHGGLRNLTHVEELNSAWQQPRIAPNKVTKQYGPHGACRQNQR